MTQVDPRIEPHLQKFCDSMFFYLQFVAGHSGVKLPATTVPFDQIPAAPAAERLRSAVAECLALILPPVPPADAPVSAEQLVAELVDAIKPLASVTQFVLLSVHMPTARRIAFEKANAAAIAAIDDAEKFLQP
jgi:hypothetical protein